MLFCCSCSDLEPVNVEAYYDMDSLINEQYALLKNTGARVRKHTSVNGKSDTALVIPDSIQWQRELSVFKKANINKPLLRGEYQVREQQTDSGMILTYRAKKEDAYVKSLEIRYGQNLAELEEVTANVSEVNPVYGSEKELRLWFQDQNGERMVSRYYISGRQKMVLKDTVTLSLMAEILYE